MKILRKTWPILSAVLLFASCSKDAGQIENPEGPLPGEEKSGVTFCFSTTEMEEPSSALHPTAATRAVDEVALQNVRVLQFDGKGSSAKLIFNEFYAADQIVTEGSAKKLYVPLFDKDENCIYVIANNNTAQLQSLEVDKLTLGQFEAMTLNFGSEKDVTLTDTALPMCGKSEDATSTATTITIPLTRMVAKVTFTCNVALQASTESFEIKRVQIVDAASKVAFVAPTKPTAQTGLFPDGSLSDNFMDYAEETVSGAPVQRTLYLPENLRGVVSGLTEKTKDTEHAPAHSTCIDVSGEYTKTTGGVSTLTDVTYRIYLGGNNSTDFNLIRNNSYNVTVTILGINSTDKRVIVEKGIPAGKYDDGEWEE